MSNAVNDTNAAKIKELEADVEHWKTRTEEFMKISAYVFSLEDKLVKAEAKIKRWEDALRFYAYEKIYVKLLSNRGYGGPTFIHPIITDNGKIARKALSDTAGSEGQGG